MSKKLKFGLKLIVKNLGNVNIKSAHVIVKIVLNISWYYSMYLDHQHLPDVKRWSEHKTILAWYYNWRCEYPASIQIITHGTRNLNSGWSKYQTIKNLIFRYLLKIKKMHQCWQHKNGTLIPSKNVTSLRQALSVLATSRSHIVSESLFLHSSPVFFSCATCKVKVLSLMTSRKFDPVTSFTSQR